MRSATKLSLTLQRRYIHVHTYDTLVCGDVIMMSLTSQRLHYERQAHVIRTKNEKLEKLCRALQQERNQLQDQVRKVS